MSRLEAEGSRRGNEHIFHSFSDEVHGGCHPGQQQACFVGRVDDDGVVDHVLDRLRFEADLTNGSGELFVRVRLNGKANLLAFADQADIAFVDKGEDLHLSHIFGDDKDRGGLQTGGHSLAGFDAALNDGAVDRSADLGVIEIGLQTQQGRFSRLERRSCGFDLSGQRAHLPFGEVALFG